MSYSNKRSLIVKGIRRNLAGDGHDSCISASVLNPSGSDHGNFCLVFGCVSAPICHRALAAPQSFNTQISKPSSPRTLNLSRKPVDPNPRILHPSFLKACQHPATSGNNYGSFRRLGVSCFGVLIVRIRLLRVLY